MDEAFRHRTPGSYQLQAAIAALHARASKAEDTDWREIELLYRMLEQLQPSPVITLNRSVAVSKVRGPAAALELIEPLARDAQRLLSLSWRARAYLMQLKRHAEAREAFDRAIARRRIRRKRRLTFAFTWTGLQKRARKGMPLS